MPEISDPNDRAETPMSLAELIRPMPGKIAVLVETKSERTPSGLLIPVETAASIHEQKATQGEVIAIGSPANDDPDADLDPDSNVRVGDTVLFGKYTGTKISYQPDRTREKQTVIVMDERSVLAVLMSPEQAKNFKVRG